MWSPDLAELAEILCPTGPAEADREPTASELRARFGALPVDIRELLLTIAERTSDVWRPGWMFKRWDMELAGQALPESPSVMEAEKIPDQPARGPLARAGVIG